MCDVMIHITVPNRSMNNMIIIFKFIKRILPIGTHAQFDCVVLSLARSIYLGCITSFHDSAWHILGHLLCYSRIRTSFKIFVVVGFVADSISPLVIVCAKSADELNMFPHDAYTYWSRLREYREDNQRWYHNSINYESLCTWHMVMAQTCSGNRRYSLRVAITYFRFLCQSFFFFVQLLSNECLSSHACISVRVAYAFVPLFNIPIL